MGLTIRVHLFFFSTAAPTEDDDNDDSGVIVEEVETSEDEQDKPLDPDMIINVDELGRCRI